VKDVDYANPALTFFVTTRAHPGRKPFTERAVAEVDVDSLNWLREHRGVCIYAYCLMPDHLHLLMRLGEDSHPLGTVLGAMKSFTTRQWWQLGHRGMLWQERFHERILREGDDPANMVLYTLENPVRAGLVREWTEYQWSGMPDPL
jgi:REP element-mobilizing transposase RayT